MVSRDGWDKVAKCLDCERDLACAACGMEQPEEHDNAAKVPSKASDEAKATLEDQVKEVIFAVIIFMQGGPPIDTQLGEWEKATNEIYDIIAPTLSSGDRKSEA